MGRGARPSLSWCPVPAAVARGPGNRSRPLERSAVALKVSSYKRGLAQICFIQQEMQGQATFFLIKKFFYVLVGFLYILSCLCVNALTLSAPLYIFMLCRRCCSAEEPLNVFILFFCEQFVKTIWFPVTEKDCLCQH